MIRIERIDSTAALEALAPEWWNLWERCPKGTPFQTPEWLTTWWKHFGCGELFVLALRADSRLAGLAPLAIDRRRVVLLGAGITDYHDILIEPEFERSGTALIFEYLAMESRHWDFCEFDDVRAFSPLLNASVPKGFESHVEPGNPCPALILPRTIAEFYASLPRGLRRNLARYRKQMERVGELSFETASAETADVYLEALFHLHAARWRGRNDPGVLANPVVRAFHLAAAPKLFQRGCLRLHALRFNGSFAAVFYAFAGHRKLHAYLSGFDPRLARYGPGTLLTAHAIGEFIREKGREFDFLRGGEPYKYYWGAVEHINRRFLLRKRAAAGPGRPMAA